jgi:hypothetical protein
MPEENEDGWIALKRYQTIPRLVTVGDEQYAFQCRFNICMAWVRPRACGSGIIYN